MTSGKERGHRVKDIREQQGDTGLQAGAEPWAQRSLVREAEQGEIKSRFKRQAKGGNGKHREGTAQTSVNMELRWMSYSKLS